MRWCACRVGTFSLMTIFVASHTDILQWKNSDFCLFFWRFMNGEMFPFAPFASTFPTWFDVVELLFDGLFSGREHEVPHVEDFYWWHGVFVHLHFWFCPVNSDGVSPQLDPSFKGIGIVSVREALIPLASAQRLFHIQCEQQSRHILQMRPK